MAKWVTEYEGTGVQKNSLYPKGISALKAADKLRLTYITGQDTRPDAEPVKGTFQGDA
jgi:hypothetical protein